jgi:hypothetical protein
MSSRPARPSDVDEICAALPETELSTSWGDRPTWKVRGKGFLLHRAPHKTAVDELGEPYDDLLVVQVADEGVKQALVDGDSPFFTVPHFDGHAAVLVSQARLGEISRDELVEVITDAWATRAPKTLLREHLGDG